MLIIINQGLKNGSNHADRHVKMSELQELKCSNEQTNGMRLKHNFQVLMNRLEC